MYFAYNEDVCLFGMWKDLFHGVLYEVIFECI